MAIPNYTTKIEATKTVNEIIAILVKSGARDVRLQYGPNSQPESVDFALKVGEQTMIFSVAAYYEGMLRAMRNDKAIPNSYCNTDQAIRTSWRIVKIWIQAQLAFAAANQATMAELFLHGAVTKDGTRLFQVLKSHGMNLLKS